ncbi:hypothetical protein D3C76_163590 [compost metagenome]
MSWLAQLLSPIVFRPRRRMGDFTAYLTIDETGEDELEITEHPVQDGTEITDHAYLKSATLNLSVQFVEGETFVPLDETYRAMLELQKSRVPFDVVTGKRVYTNMLFKSLRQTTDKNTDNVLAIQATLREIKIVPVVVTTVPPRDKQATPGKTGATQRAGTKKAQPVKPQEQTTKKSALKKISGLL